MKLGMEKSLTEKLPKLNVPLNPKGKKLRAPGQPGHYIDQDELEIDEDEYKEKVHEMENKAKALKRRYEKDLTKKRKPGCRRSILLRR